MRTLERRVQRLEAERSADEEVTHAEWVIWTNDFLMHAKEPFDADTQRRYDEFVRRLVKSKIYRLFEESARKSSQNNVAGAVAIASVEPAVTTPEHAPASRADPVFEEPVSPLDRAFVHDHGDRAAQASGARFH